MRERCGLCIQWAVALWWHDDHDQERHLCGHHSDDRAEAMVSAGWQQIVDERVEELHPSLGPVTSDPVTH